MKRLLLASVFLLLLAAFVAAPAFGAESAVPMIPAGEAPAATASATAPAECGEGIDLPTFLTTPLNELSAEDLGPLDCNCNDHPDCKAICGDEGDEVSSSCFIGPVCNNFPRFRGKCQCAKQADPIGIDAVAGTIR